jgi:hypothetical protein
MAGTVTVAEKVLKPVKQIVWSWTSTSGGAADLITTLPYAGQVTACVTIPAGGGSAPTDNYDITITDAYGYDVLQGTGANRDTANTETAVPTATSIAFGTLTLNVTNAGDTKGGTVILYVLGG